MSFWRPIATAPKDGTPVLLFVPEQEIEIMVACFDDGSWWNPHDCEGKALYYQPTHWMQLPTSP